MNWRQLRDNVGSRCEVLLRNCKLSRKPCSERSLVRPAEHGEEFGKDHCRGTPDLHAPDPECGHRERHRVAMTLGGHEMLRIQKLINANLEDPRHFVV